MAAVPAGFRRALEAGEAASRTLVESLVIDHRRLMTVVLRRGGVRALGEEERGALAPGEPITARMWAGARVLRDRFGDGAAEAFVDHRSDTVRGWASYVIGLEEGVGLERRLARVRAYADDPHQGVREWAWLGVRGAIVDDLDVALREFAAWSCDESANIRRFGSEATRPRGVWCRHIRALREEPGLAMGVLEPLRSDPSGYVQDSVANWLNDASKDAPGWVVGVCARWERETGGDAATARICRRGLRTIRARGGAG